MPNRLNDITEELRKWILNDEALYLIVWPYARECAAGCYDMLGWQLRMLITPIIQQAALLSDSISQQLATYDLTDTDVQWDALCLWFTDAAQDELDEEEWDRPW